MKSSITNCNSNDQMLQLVSIQLLQKAHTHTPFNGPFSGTTRVSRYQNGKTNLDLLKQETVSGSGISWATCKSAPSSRQIKAGCPSCRPTNSVKALKAKRHILANLCLKVQIISLYPFFR